MRSQVSPLVGMCSLLNFVELSFMFSPIGIALRGAGAQLLLCLRSNVLYSFHLSSHVLFGNLLSRRLPRVEKSHEVLKPKWQHTAECCQIESCPESMLVGVEIGSMDTDWAD